ncbi:MAG: transcription antitermination factor NusB, partial [Oscillospiraceae bacterium]
MKRRDAREAAFLLTFEKEFRSEPLEELIETAVECRSLELDEYSDRLVRAVDERREEIDEIISAHLATWKLARLPKVTLAVLRLAVGELETFETIPVRVSINEAIELAKK